MKRRYPTIGQANAMFFVIAVITLAGSIFFLPRLGVGRNLWINEFVYILFPPLLLAWLNKWPVEEVYRYRNTTAKNKIISILSGISTWFVVYYISLLIYSFLNHKLGVLIIPEQAGSSIYQNIILIIGMVILAPICEETLFRGFLQRAYEGHSKKYGFLITGLIFGAYHVLNGVGEVIPVTVLGIAMGYLTYKTGSILSSMLFHGAANLCAIFAGGILPGYMAEGIPPWFHILTFVCLIISFLLLRSLGAEQSGNVGTEESGNIQTEESRGIHTGPAPLQIEEELPSTDKKISATAIIFFILFTVFLVGVGALEIIYRINGVS